MMKKILFSIALTLVSVLSLTAQVSEGHISFKIEIGSDNPDMAMMASMMEGAKLEVYFKNEKSRSEMQMGTIGTTTTIIDPSAENSLMLMNMMGMKVATLIPHTELDKKSDSTKLKVTLVNETKTIIGYKCKKAIVTDDSGFELTYWYTQELIANFKGQKTFNEFVPGVPLEFTFNQSGISMEMTATKFEKTVDSKLFDVTVPEGYTVKNLDEMKQFKN